MTGGRHDGGETRGRAVLLRDRPVIPGHSAMAFCPADGRRFALRSYHPLSGANSLSGCKRDIRKSKNSRMGRRNTLDRNISAGITRSIAIFEGTSTEPDLNDVHADPSLLGFAGGCLGAENGVFRALRDAEMDVDRQVVTRRHFFAFNSIFRRCRGGLYAT